MSIFRLPALAFIVSCSSAFSQSLQLEEIMKGLEFTGREPVNYQWSNDGKQVIFDWNPRNEPLSSTWSYDLHKKTLAVQKETVRLYDPKNESRFFVEGNTLVEETLKSRKIIFAGDLFDFQTLKNGVFFRSGNQCYSYSSETGLRLLAEITENAEPSAEKLSYLERQQLELFSGMRKDTLVRKLRREKSPDTIPKIHIHSGETLVYVSATNDLKYIVFRVRSAEKEQLTNMPEYVTRSGEVVMRSTRSKVTSTEEKNTLGILQLSTGKTTLADPAKLTGVFERPAYFGEYGITGNYESPKNVIYHLPLSNGFHAVLVDIRSCDNKDRWIVLLDCATGIYREISHQHDEAWIGGPGIFEWKEAVSALDWLDDHTIYYQSEQSGFSHLYSYDLKTSKEKQLTSGNFEVYDAVLSKDKKSFYLILNKLHPGVRNGYRLDIASSKLTPLFEGHFGMDWKLSPDEKHWLISKSEMLHPSQLFIAENKPGAQLHPIQETETSVFKALKLQEPEVISFTASDGKQVYARLYRPENGKRNGAAVGFVHGAGYLQNAHYYWSYYRREMLFHQLLAQEGFTVIDVDYRASEGYGRDHRTAIYRHMGDRDLQDYVDAKKLLVAQYGIDSNKVGIYGGSYGGFLTLMALFKTSEFACGAALRSVTDWAHYNQEYTANILNYPETDSIAYRRSSPIYFAEGLSKPLLMAHGVEDDNVHFQDIVRLNERLIELRKKNYSLAIYPVEGHSFVETDSWIDEYSRILELFRTNLIGE